MIFSEAREAFNDAKDTIESVDCIAFGMAQMLVGRLRKCGSAELAKLKRELRNFDMRTKTWRKR